LSLSPDLSPIQGHVITVGKHLKTRALRDKIVPQAGYTSKTGAKFFELNKDENEFQLRIFVCGCHLLPEDVEASQRGGFRLLETASLKTVGYLKRLKTTRAHPKERAASGTLVPEMLQQIDQLTEVAAKHKTAAVASESNRKKEIADLKQQNHILSLQLRQAVEEHKKEIKKETLAHESTKKDLKRAREARDVAYYTKQYKKARLCVQAIIKKEGTI
jgi:DNA gyrase/topoisomerase IV subunit A